MKLKCIFLCLLLVLLTGGHVFALSNGEIYPNRQTIIYNVNLMDEIKAMIIEGEWGLTSTLSGGGRYTYNPQNNYLDLFLKFKLYDGYDLRIAGKLGLCSDFQKITEVNKTLGFVFTKVHNSFININGGCDYSMVDGQLGFFGGIDYQLASKAFLQAGWQKLIGQTGTDGFVIGLRTDI